MIAALILVAALGAAPKCGYSPEIYRHPRAVHFERPVPLKLRPCPGYSAEQRREFCAAQNQAARGQKIPTFVATPAPAATQPLVPGPTTYVLEGPQGPPGAPGKDGRDGVDGLDGIAGRDGVDGRDAMPGPVDVSADGCHCDHVGAGEFERIDGELAKIRLALSIAHDEALSAFAFSEICLALAVLAIVFALWFKKDRARYLSCP